MNFNLTQIQLSKNDIKKGVRLPNSLTEELAEFIGVMMGDGHLGYYVGLPESGKKYVDYQIKIAGNKNEKEYLEHVMDLFYSLFNIQFYYTQDTAPNGIILRKQSKGILQFLHKIGGIPLNSKAQTACIPEIILKSSPTIKRAFLRGLSDTDFSVSFKSKYKTKHCYPVIKATFKSKKLVQDLELLYTELNFRYSTYYNEERYDKRWGNSIEHNIYLNGRDNLYRWISTIGFSNPKFQIKVKKWLEDGMCPPGYK